MPKDYGSEKYRDKAYLSERWSAFTSISPPHTCSSAVQGRIYQNTEGIASGMCATMLGTRNGSAHSEYDQVMSGRGRETDVFFENASRNASPKPARIERIIHITLVQHIQELPFRHGGFPKTFDIVPLSA